MDNIILLCPTKGRPELFQRLKESYDENHSNKSTLFPIIDTEEELLYKLDRFLIKTGNLVEKLNLFFEQTLLMDFVPDYIGWVADDIIIKTPNFDEMIINTFKEQKHTHVIYCNDNLNGDKIANHWVMRTSKVKEIGFFALPQCKHMFIDNFWTQIGKETNSIQYLENVMWEHDHYLKHRQPLDDTYKLSNNQETFEHDQKVFDDFCKSSEYNRVKEILSKHAE